MLPHSDDFARLVRRIHDHDANAFADLMSRYESEVCQLIEARLRHVRARRLLDATDVWQAVLLRLFVQSSDGRLCLDDPDRLLHLLRKAALNELRDQTRWGRRERRDSRRELANDRLVASFADTHALPDQIVEERDLLDDALRHLHLQERQLALGWAAGKDWNELAHETGGTAESARKQFSRAMTRLASAYA